MEKCLIFGGTGSLGRKLIERYLPTHEVAAYSRDEAKHFTLRNEFGSGPLSSHLSKLKFFVGDIRDTKRIADVLRQYKPTTLIIAAALKQVDTCELSPNESVLTNLIGTQNVIDVVNSAHHPPKTVLFVSTDKACAPVNVYGMCKAISERIVTSQARTGDSSVRFLAVRYGNVLESRGSIIPLFKHQAAHDACLTVTDPEMTRFLMTLDDSVNLINKALQCGKSGETWIPKLDAMKIGDLADIFSRRSGKPVKIVGLRPGEKKHEDLINESETSRTRSWNEGYYVIDPAFKVGDSDFEPYCSSDIVLTRELLETRLSKLGILDASLDNFKGRAIDEIVTHRSE